jgi:hypothetical protein
MTCLCAAVLAAFSLRETGQWPRPQSGVTRPLGSQAAEPPAPKFPLMSTEEREFLWQVEHHVNLLGQHGFAALALL